MLSASVKTSPLKSISSLKSSVIIYVGTRKATSFGKSFTEKLVKELAPYQPVIVSGLAYGIDIAAHKAALKYGLKTITVFAHGLDRVYPSAHASIAKEIQQSGGLVTEFLSGTNSDRQNFPKRNRIVAGLSDATIVIESAVKGGSLITADIANSYNREVFSVPGSPNQTQSKGCNYLIKTQQAILLESSADIVKGLNWDVKEKIIQQSVFVELSIKLITPSKSLYFFILLSLSYAFITSYAKNISLIGAL